MSNNSYSVFIPGGETLPTGPAVILEPGPQVAIEEETYTTELLESVRTIDVGNYALLRGAMDQEVLESYEPTAFFNEIPDLGRTRGDSGHGVRFGQLILNSPFGDERAELVALKPFDRISEVAKEFSLSRYFAASDGVTQPFSTFQPLGILHGTDGTYSMISKYEHGVRSLDNVFYNPEVTDDSTVLTRAIGKCAALLASMHAQGFSYGDTQVKNMFVSNHRELFIADLESIKSFRITRSGDIDEIDCASRTQSNLTTLARSMLKGREDLVDDHPHIPDTFFNLIYFTIVNSPQSVVPMGARKSLRELSAIFEDPFSISA